MAAMFSGASTDYFSQAALCPRKVRLNHLWERWPYFHCIQIINLKVGTNEKIRRVGKLKTEYVVFFSRWLPTLKVREQSSPWVENSICNICHLLDPLFS